MSSVSLDNDVRVPRPRRCESASIAASDATAPASRASSADAVNRLVISRAGSSGADASPHGVCPRGRSRDRDHAMRPPRAARAAFGQRRRRPAAPAWNRARSGRDVHGRHRGAGPARPGRRAGQQRGSRCGDRRALRLRAPHALPLGGRAASGPAVPAGAVRSAYTGKRLLVGAPCRRGARLRLRPLRGADPGRRHSRKRLQRRHPEGRRGRSELRRGSGRGDARLRARGPRRRGTDPPDRPRSARRAFARRHPDRHRAADGLQRGRPLRGGAGP